ncbi:MAG: hypothetical protein V7L31_05735 [Nostoc sp.]|uniref:hypothetical protein n=1 Tax=Nostoc sp. TaxID=1180 RepID=UPI002FF360D3
MFDLTYQIHLPHLLYCLSVARRRHRRIKLAGKLEDLEALGYSLGLGFLPLIKQHYGLKC